MNFSSSPKVESKAHFLSFQSGLFAVLIKKPTSEGELK